MRPTLAWCVMRSFKGAPPGDEEWQFVQSFPTQDKAVEDAKKRALLREYARFQFAVAVISQTHTFMGAHKEPDLLMSYYG